MQLRHLEEELERLRKESQVADASCKASHEQLRQMSQETFRLQSLNESIKIHGHDDVHGVHIRNSVTILRNRFFDL